MSVDRRPSDDSTTGPQAPSMQQVDAAIDAKAQRLKQELKQELTQELTKHFDTKIDSSKIEIMNHMDRLMGNAGAGGAEEDA
ncbi:hypothetical protein HYH02_007902 [Chlamydomonas schloesseri]|uniref:Uncharacterized protein n=1 Tax=Chlamydomonas schloesseri TaxID=2026947 RepID=A0A836B449_9CHLO|nr:hypothetical protein HYH02_007902 [Chlamydomonas schloesseri]|eukprot:KAG2447156.1 hypothetical protein HYH02_007902 [Chlamydomonas schloesseri]